VRAGRPGPPQAARRRAARVGDRSHRDRRHRRRGRAAVALLPRARAEGAAMRRALVIMAIAACRGGGGPPADARAGPAAAAGAIGVPSSGRHRIPPLRLEFTDGRPGPASGAQTFELMTEEIPLQVAPISADRTGAELKPAKGVMDPVVGRRSPWPWIAGGAGLL